MANQHRITALGVERAVGFVREGVVPQRCAALQRQGFGEVLRLKLFEGLARAARKAWVLTISKASNREMAPANGNTHHKMVMR